MRPRKLSAAPDSGVPGVGALRPVFLEGAVVTDQWYRRPQALIAAGVFALTLAVYVVTLNPTTPFWDCGEFITTSHIVGIPHQPGTPLYVLMGRVFDIVFGSPDIAEAALRTAWAVNFMSAFFSALAVMFVYLLIFELARRADPDAGWLPHVGGLCGALFLAFSETFWNNAIEAEVYGLAGFMIAALSWLAVHWWDKREHEGSNQLVLLMIYLLGLGVGFHLGTLLAYFGIAAMMYFAPRRQLAVSDLALLTFGLIVFIFSTASKQNTLVLGLLAVFFVAAAVRAIQGSRVALAGGVLFFIGLTVHVMMMIRAGASPEPFINQTDPDNFKTLLSVIRREQYPPMNIFERRAPLDWQFGYYYDFLFKQFYFVGDGQAGLSRVVTFLGPILLALLGLAHGLRRLRPLVLVPLVGYLINGEALTVYLNFTSHEVRDRDYFYFAAFMFAAVFIGLGAAALLRLAAQQREGKSADQITAAGGDWRRDAGRVKIAPAAVVLAVVLVALPLSQARPWGPKYFEHDNSRNLIAYQYAKNIMAGLDENAILFTNGDNDTFPIWYLQEVEKYRRDITVVNLSLINLPWYILQLKDAPEKPLAMARSSKEIHDLRHRIYEDPQTGEQTIIMIKDYVLHDILSTNHRGARRPVFFAVTIPRDNMLRYYPNLQMEGMAYRLLDEAAPDEMPVADPQRSLENALGNYFLSSVLTTDDAARHARFLEMKGLRERGDTPVTGEPLDEKQLRELAGMLGEFRGDVFRNTNARHLLGNYPAALNRSGYEFYMEANRAAETDTAGYRRNLRKALAAFEASLIIDPWNDQALDLYPLLLVQNFEDERAKQFLQSLSGNVPPEREEDIVYTCLRGFVRGGVPELAVDWIEDQMAREPDRLFYYHMAFTVYQALDDLAQAERVAEAWRVRTGAEDPDMAANLERLHSGQQGGGADGR